jgi:hypothetical protein
MDQSTKIAIGAILGLAAIGGAVYIAGALPSPLPQTPKPLPPKPPQPPQPPVPPPQPPPPLDPTAVKPNTTFEGTLTLTPDAGTAPATELDVTDLLGAASMTPMLVQPGSDVTSWTVVVVYIGKTTIDITSSPHARTGDGRGYTASWSNTFTVGGSV